MSMDLDGLQSRFGAADIGDSYWQDDGCKDAGAKAVISQLERQGARREDGVVRVSSDRTYYLYFQPDNVPGWVGSSPFLQKCGELDLFLLNLVNCVGMIRLGPVDLDVECKKLSSAEFRRLVSEVSEYLLQLPFGYRGAGAGYEHVLEFERSIDYHRLVC